MTRDPEVIALVQESHRLISQATRLHGALVDHATNLADWLQRADQITAHLGSEPHDPPDA